MAATVAAERPGFGHHVLSERQHAILNVAARIFAERGFARTDVQLIADEAKVGKGTVYRNFGTKEELFLAAVDREIRGLTEVLVEASERQSNALESVKAAIRSYLAYFDSRSYAVELLIIERAKFRNRNASTYFRYVESLRDYWENLMSRLIEEGTFRELSAHRTFDLISDVLYGTIFTNQFADRHESYEEQAESVIDMLMNGFLAKL